MKQLFIFVFSLFIVMEVNAQQVIPLYNGAIPGAKTPPSDYKETSVAGTDGVVRVSKVTDPSLIAYIPAKPNGTAVIICPGGGYGILAIDKEGHNVAKKFNEVGITAFVLKYRLPSDLIMDDKSMGPLQDALQAIYLVRKNANVWGINPAKIGIMGFSAGGHLAASLSVHYNDMKVQNQENISLRPDFSLLIYPVITFGSYTHAGSVKNLLGEQPTDAQRRYFSSELHINAQTPPAFLVHANNDGTVPVKNSLAYDEALAKNKVPAEMHIYQAGGHGFGLNNKTTKENWFETLKNWMRANNLLSE
ncbi:alpha/beta hydrolase fold domain-containing protein [Pedobacter sp. LMG 31464]|uniref:Alpha/beta hydrolase fold domain-containing protein n=1 Tax=Pedobacter planticolens TaxID=2679964 RepID=A0A923IXR8_9SPHI|nr:alpha/beta hydrolase [Pedobacter planticolens]MBB2146637.1 alpha/beta hydrolase fold domain-containing protein [Pedobacter planticolens]